MPQRPAVTNPGRFSPLDRAMDEMEHALTRLSPWDGRSRDGASQAWLGTTSARFCRQVLDALDWYPDVLPDNLDPVDVRRIMEDELETIERLCRRRDRLRRLSAHADAAVQSTGGNLMETVMEVYSLLASSGRARGITAVPGPDDPLA